MYIAHSYVHMFVYVSTAQAWTAKMGYDQMTAWPAIPVYIVINHTLRVFSIFMGLIKFLNGSAPFF